MKLKYLIPMLAMSWGSAQAIYIDNGVNGDGFWQVDVLDAGDSRQGNIDPNGPAGPTDVIFDFFTYIDVGANGGAIRLSDTTTSPAALNGNQVISSGTFNGPNGPINWTATASIAAGSSIYELNLSFSSTAPFGNIRLISYLDEDVSTSNDVLIEIGTPGQADFQLLTLDANADIGISHAVDYNPSGLNYIGWAADQYSDLRDAITGAGASYAPNGVVDMVDLPAYNDPRHPGQNAYGPNDITDAFAFDFDPNATQANVSFFLGGSPNAQPPQPPQPPQPQQPKSIPTLSTLGIGLLSLLLAGIGYRRKIQ